MTDQLKHKPIRLIVAMICAVFLSTLVIFGFLRQFYTDTTHWPAYAIASILAGCAAVIGEGITEALIRTLIVCLFIVLPAHVWGNTFVASLSVALAVASGVGGIASAIEQRGPASNN